MERAFGRSFRDVRTHTDDTARRLSAELHARAFTVGDHVAFAAGQYQPGTLVGDALVAHELAHVAQQSGDVTTASAGDEAALEKHADASAIAALASLHLPQGPMGAQPRPGKSSGLRLQRCSASRQAARGTTAAGRLTCPPAGAAAPAPATEGRRLDARAGAIIAIAEDTSRPLDERARTVVRGIICAYFPRKAELVSSVEYDAALPGLDVTTVRDGSTIRGRIGVGRYFVEQTRSRHFARRVLQVQHELQHIEQWRAGMTGGARSSEREFLAFHREALAPELPGTGRMPHATRVALIDAALGNYNCLSPEKQTEYRGMQEELLRRRPEEVRASGRDASTPPTECRR